MNKRQNGLMTFFLLVAIMFASGCSVFTTHADQTTSFKSVDFVPGNNLLGNKGENTVRIISVDAKRRIIIEKLEENKFGELVRMYCAEPSPDALPATADVLSASYSKSDGDSIDIGKTLAETAKNIGLRTQSIQLMRDAMYRNCEVTENLDYFRGERRKVLLSSLVPDVSNLNRSHWSATTEGVVAVTSMTEIALNSIHDNDKFGKCTDLLDEKEGTQVQFRIIQNKVDEGEGLSAQNWIFLRKEHPDWYGQTGIGEVNAAVIMAGTNEQELEEQVETGIEKGQKIFQQEHQEQAEPIATEVIEKVENQEGLPEQSETEIEEKLKKLENQGELLE